MSYNQMNRSYNLSYDKLWSKKFPSCRKVVKVTIACSYSHQSDFFWLEISIEVTLKLLLLVVAMEKSSKSGRWLQNKRCSLMAGL